MLSGLYKSELAPGCVARQVLLNVSNSSTWQFVLVVSLPPTFCPPFMTDNRLVSGSVKKPLKFLFKNFKKVSEDLSLDLNLRPQNLTNITYYKICNYYEKLLKKI